uniref:Cadherin domain-containing protein n=1 Tax=Ascaris lumbricoides TaxID=6252 RepID=A0A9J2Q753_ASCLU
MAAVTYEYILTGLGATIFAVDQQGYVYLNAPSVDADPPNPSSYELIIEAREVNTTPIRSSEPIKITIHIIDINDNVPTFSSSIYMANVSANGRIRPVIEIFAVDNDAGKFAHIEYKIVSVTNGAFGNFYYDSDSKQLMAIGQLVPSEKYEVVLEARDGGGLWSQAKVIVLATEDSSQHSRNKVEKFSEFPVGPALPDSSELSAAGNMAAGEASSESVQTFVTEISEATPPHSIVLTLGVKINFRGTIMTTATFDRETTQMYNLQIEARSSPSKQHLYWTVVQIAVLNVIRGTIMTTATFDRETTQMYNLQIEARSWSTKQHLYWTVVQIAVLDVNDNAPEFVDPKPIRLQIDLSRMKELKSDMVIGRITVRDPDSQDNGRIELRILPPMDRLFTVNNDGLVIINGNVTSAHFGEHRIVFIATDHGDPPLESRAYAIITVNGIDYTERSMTNTIDQQSFTVTTDAFETFKQKSNELMSTQQRTMFTFAPSIEELFTITPISKGALMTVISLPSSTQPPFIGPERSITSYPPTQKVIDVVPFTNAAQLPFLPTTTSPPSTRLAPIFDPSKIIVDVDENETDIDLVELHAYYPDNMPGTITYVLVVGDPSLFSVNSQTGAVHLVGALDAEAEPSYELRVTTAEASELRVEPEFAHVAIVTVKISDINDWIPNFELNSYAFTINSSVLPGTVIGQVTAFDQDREEPNNRIRYRLINANGFENYFSVDPENGQISVKKSPNLADTDEKIMLTIEAADEGKPKQASETIVVIGVERENEQISAIRTSGAFVSSPAKDALQFSLRNYTTTASEAARPPQLIQILPVKNKPADTRFIACSIVSGNYRDAFSISTGADGNCELRTQMELDRETIEHYLLNVTVENDEQKDFALVGITVLDENDNIPQFVFDNELSLPIYFAAIALNAPAFTHVVKVKAEDADIGNNSEIVYSLDEGLSDSKFFSIDQRSGEIETKMSMAQLQNINRKAYFDIKVRACDSPLSGQILCSKADVIINVIRDVHRFITTVSGVHLQQIHARKKVIH